MMNEGTLEDKGQRMFDSKQWTAKIIIKQWRLHSLRNMLKA